MHALNEELRAQVALVQACAQSASASGDPRLRSAWIGVIVRLMNASTATGSVIADLKWAPPNAFLVDLPVRLRLPNLPALPDVEGGPPPNFRKTTSDRIPNQISNLGSSPAKRGRGTAEGGGGGGSFRPLAASRHSPRCAGGEPVSLG